MSVALPIYLFGLLALSLPWLLHRFGQQQAERRDFASDRFLEAVPPPVSERHRLRHLILFALRCLALLLLCLLFARPFLGLLGERDAPRTLHAVVLDTSYSMRADGRFERAVDALRERLQDLPEQDLVRLYTFARQLRPVGDEAIAPTSARVALGTLSPGYARGDYGQLMRGLDVIAARADLPVEALVASDLQRSALPVRRNDLFAPSLAGLELIDVAAGRPVANVSLEASASTADRATARLRVQVSASDGGEAVSGTLRVRHDGEVLHSEPLTVSAAAPWQRTIDALSLPPTEVEALTVAFIGEDDDALPDDDRQVVALRRERAFQVTLMGIGTPLSERTRVFLQTALQGGDGVEVARAAGGSRQLPDDADLTVVVLDPDDAPSLASVEEAVRRGADVLAILPAAHGSLSADQGGTAARSGQGRRIGEVEQAHPLDAGRVDWFGVRRYADSRFDLDDDDRVLVAGDDGQPLLSERPLSGSGRLLLLDDPLDGDASNLPFEPAFVELLDVVREWVDSDGALPERLAAGSALALPDGVQVFDPDGQALLSLEQRGGAERLVLAVPGLYRVVDSRGERVIQVGSEAAESRLSGMASEVRNAWQDRHDAVRAGEGAAPDDGATPDQRSAAARPDTRLDQRWLLAALLPLLVLVVLGESLLGNRRLNVRRDGS